MSPNETLFLESTNKIVKDDISNSSFVQFRVREHLTIQKMKLTVTDFFKLT